MDKDEIICMAREAGLHKMIQVKHVVDKVYEIPSENLERFAALVAAHERETTGKVSLKYMNQQVLAEREACAKVCEEIFSQCVDDFEAGAADECAAAIRARGEK